MQNNHKKAVCYYELNDKTAANVKAIKPSGIRKFFDIAAQVSNLDP